MLNGMVIFIIPLVVFRTHIDFNDRTLTSVECASSNIIIGCYYKRCGLDEMTDSDNKNFNVFDSDIDSSLVNVLVLPELKL